MNDVLAASAIDDIALSGDRVGPYVINRMMQGGEYCLCVIDPRSRRYRRLNELESLLLIGQQYAFPNTLHVPGPARALHHPMFAESPDSPEKQEPPAAHPEEQDNGR